MLTIQQGLNSFTRILRQPAAKATSCHDFTVRLHQA